MTDDPLDRPPADHGSDRYDYVEIIDAPEGVEPTGLWWADLLAAPCPDCRANIFARWQPRWRLADETAGDQQHWQITIAHDETCPRGPAR